MPVKRRARQLRLGTLAAISEQAVVTLASALRQLPGTRDFKHNTDVTVYGTFGGNDTVGLSIQIRIKLGVEYSHAIKKTSCRLMTLPRGDARGQTRKGYAERSP